MIEKTTTCSEFITKVYRDLGLDYSNWELDAIEWVGEALQHIGAFAGEEQVSEKIVIANHRVLLPPALTKLHSVFLLEEEDRVQLTWHGRGLHAHLIDDDELDEEYTYTIDSDYLHTAIPEGTVLIVYNRLRLGSDGYPLIPDHVSFREALLWYVQMKLALGGWKHPAGLDYSSIRVEWLRYCTQARGRMLYPTVDEYAAFTRGWASLVPTTSVAAKYKDISYGNDTYDDNNTIDGGYL